MNILVTAGNTQVKIDQVRVIANVFKGTTGALIAEEAARAGHTVTLVTSNRSKLTREPGTPGAVSRVVDYTTFDELAEALERELSGGGYDAIVHSAAVSDYGVTGVMVPLADGALAELDASTKVSGSHPVMYLRLEPLPKLVDRFRSDYGFDGILVKFKLQVGIGDAELLDIAEKSRLASGADFIVANCREWATERAYILDDGGGCEVARGDLAKELLRKIEEGRPCA